MTAADIPHRFLSPPFWWRTLPALLGGLMLQRRYARQLAEARGIAPGDWDAAVAEWTARMTRNHAVGKRFNSLYMGR